MMWRHHHMDTYNGSLGFPTIVFWLFLIFMVLVFIFVVYALWKIRNKDSHIYPDRALTILRERYARGEIIRRNTENDYRSFLVKIEASVSA